MPRPREARLPRRLALRGPLRPGAVLVLAGWAVVIGSTAGMALSDGDILGDWCGSESNYSITRQAMTVTRRSDNARLVFDVVELKQREATISVSWRRADGKVVRTDFTEFSADGKKMVQLSNSGGPRREFKRC